MEFRYLEEWWASSAGIITSALLALQGAQIVLAASAAGLTEAGQVTSEFPEINKIEPETARAGDKLFLKGVGFARSLVVVAYSDPYGATPLWAGRPEHDTAIVIPIPERALMCSTFMYSPLGGPGMFLPKNCVDVPVAGEYRVGIYLEREHKVSNTLALHITATSSPPWLSSVSPTLVEPGQRLKLYGAGLTGPTNASLISIDGRATMLLRDGVYSQDGSVSFKVPATVTVCLPDPCIDRRIDDYGPADYWIRAWSVDARPGREVYTALGPLSLTPAYGVTVQSNALRVTIGPHRPIDQPGSRN